MVDFFFVLPQLVRLGLQGVQALGQLHALGGGDVVQTLLHVGDGGAVAALHLVHIVRADAGDGVRLVAVHVDQRLETVLLATVEQPVDGALLVNLQMIFVEVIQEVIPDDLAWGAFAAQRVRNEPQVFFQRVRAVDGLEPVDEHGHDVVGEIVKAR